MLYYEIPWFYEDFKSENLCFLNLYAERILDLSQNTFKILKTFPSYQNRYNISTF